MATVDTKITIDSEVQTQAQEMLAGFGLDISTAVDLFLRQMLRENTIPFGFGREIPNKETLTALQEAEDMESHPELYKTFYSVDDLMRDLLDEV